MKKLLGTVVFAAALMTGAVAQAAFLNQINVVATERPLEQGTWDLTVETALPIAAIGVNTPEGLTFTINNAGIAPFGSGSAYTPAATAGRLSLNLNALTCVGINCTPFATTTAPTLLGTFTGVSTSLAEIIFPDDDSVGGTAFDGTNTAYDAGLVSVQNYPVPEPGAALMLGFGLAALGLIRRKAA